MTETIVTGRRVGEVPRAGVELGGALGAIAEARDFTTSFLDRSAPSSGPWPERGVDAARLVVSELVTNVVKYAPGPCRLELALDDGVLEISVHDTHPVAPVARPRNPDRLGQHGLEIVLALCDTVETEAAAPHGKWVRARLPLG
ncbi:ATP-binding protein [Streptomyces sp. NPDC008121]|uniref:ATP-binding protein n=1 Tax=Streptomyces sp. NPDC008121 TaxID=3364809 RepID=UPI0036F1308E